MKKLKSGSEKFHFLYYIENKINGKLYIGITKNPAKRWKKHLTTAKGGPEKQSKTYSYIHKAINKYGVENFVFNVYDTAISKAEANEKETFWIAEMKRLEIPIYNLTNGGDGISGYIYTEEELKAMSERMKGKMDGEKNPFFGQKHSEETKELLSKQMTERHQNKEFVGSNHSQSKLNEEQVLEIRRLYEETSITQPELAEKFKVDRGAIQSILKNRTWTHIKLSDLTNKDNRQLIKQNNFFDKKCGPKIVYQLCCEFCSKQFEFTKRENGKAKLPRFCSKGCKNAAFGAMSRANAKKNQAS